jgi:hypothetical protein
MSENVRKKETRSIAGKDGKTHRHQIRQQPSGTSSSSPMQTTPNPASKIPKKILASASKLPTSYQPSRGDIFQDLYISHFIHLQDASVTPWITQLPNLASSPSGPSELYGIRAATMASYGRISGNRDLEIEASHWYSKGLDAQRETLPLAAKSLSYQPCGHRAVAAALLFSYFESVVCTMPIGWMQHYIAATKMLEIAGAEKCQTGLMHMLFRSIRIAAVRNSVPFFFLPDELTNTVHYFADNGRALCPGFGNLVYGSLQPKSKDAI